MKKVPGHFEIVRTFHFEAAHYMPNVPEGHMYRRLHGHSFTVEIALAGPTSEEHGWVVDFADLDKAYELVIGELDHRLLNEIEGLEMPTMESIAQWIASRLKPDMPALSRVSVTRPGRGQYAHFHLAD